MLITIECSSICFIILLLDQFEESNNLLNWILGGVVIFLAAVIISLVVKIRNLNTGAQEIIFQVENLDIYFCKNI